MGEGGQFPPVLFSCSRFLNPRGPDYLGAWTRLHRHRHIIIIIISLFVVCLFVCLFVFSHSVWWWFLLFDKFRDTAPFIIFICISLIVKKTLSVRTSISFILSFQSKSNKHNTFIIAKVTFLKHHPYKCFVCLHARNNRKA